MTHNKFERYYDDIDRYINWAAGIVNAQFVGKQSTFSQTDLVNEGLLYALKKMPEYDPSQGAVSSYLNGAYFIMKEYATKNVRASGQRLSDNYDAAYEPNLDAALQWSEVSAALSPEEKQLLYDRIVNETPTETMAQQRKTTRNRIRLALRDIMKKVENGRATGDPGIIDSSM